MRDMCKVAPRVLIGIPGTAISLSLVRLKWQEKMYNNKPTQRIQTFFSYFYFIFLSPFRFVGWKLKMK